MAHKLTESFNPNQIVVLIDLPQQPNESFSLGLAYNQNKISPNEDL